MSRSHPRKLRLGLGGGLGGMGAQPERFSSQGGDGIRRWIWQYQPVSRQLWKSDSQKNKSFFLWKQFEQFLGVGAGLFKQGRPSVGLFMVWFSWPGFVLAP